MALSAFDDKSAPPSDRAIRKTLGSTSDLWFDLKKSLRARCGPLDEDWNFSGKAYGWSLRVKRGKRAIVYMTPCQEYFLASFALGEKACRAAARTEGCSPSVLALIEKAPRYAEGRGVRIPVRAGEDLDSVVTLAAIKLAS
jgi:hypothetical protein